LQNGGEIAGKGSLGGKYQTTAEEGAKIRAPVLLAGEKMNKNKNPVDNFT
jgi:hypothetical protein